MTAPIPPSMPGPALPSTRTLVRSTLVAVAVAAALLLTVVLPAEYGIDLTGAGRVLGLTQMGEIKVRLAREAAEDAAADAAALDAAEAEAAASAAPTDSGAATVPAGSATSQ